MGEGVEAGTMRQGCGVENAILRAERVNIGIVAVATEEEVAVGQNRALRPPRRAAGVEEPGLSVGRYGRAGQRRPLAETHPVLAAGGEDRRQRALGGLRA